jgi:hypothetical protein
MARCLIGLALLPVPLAAQMHVPIGFIAGVTRADFHGKDVTGGKGVTGLVFGGLVHLELPGPLALEPQLLYIHKGGRLSGEGATATFEIGYLQLPVLLRREHTLAPASRLSLALFAGPAAGFTTRCTVTVEAVSFNPINTTVLGLDTRSVRPTGH